MCDCRDLICMLATLAVLAFAGGMAYHYLKPDGDPIADLQSGVENTWPKFKEFWPTIEEFMHEGSKFNATTPEEADRWDTRGSYGLSLELLNALEERWYPYFETAVSDWEAGDPDVLTLSTSIVDVDNNCSAVPGVMKVCNGDYGDTQWHGINYALVQGSYITASQALMNEYYLAKSFEARKQYTMCHEIGHGFGLPHSDENFWNKDLGNCMDYTNTPQDNMHPDRTNFVFLAALYGTVDGPWEGDSNQTATTQSVGDDDNGGGGDTTTKKKSTTPSGERLLRKKQQQHDSIRQRIPLIHNFEIPSWVLTALNDVRAENEKPYDENDIELLYFQSNRRLLHHSEFAISYAVDLGEGYSIRVQKLLATGLDHQ